jgi:hypothetical protein
MIGKEISPKGMYRRLNNFLGKIVTCSSDIAEEDTQHYIHTLLHSSSLVVRLQVLHACDEIDHPTSHVNAAVSYDITENPRPYHGKPS